MKPRPRRPTTRPWRVLPALLAAACALVVSAAPAATALSARADVPARQDGAAGVATVAPFRLAGPVTDQVGALGSHQGDVQAALDDLSHDTGTDLWVVYVASFDGQGGADWADATARASQLGSDQFLLAVALDDRAYGLHVPSTTTRTSAQVDAADTAIRRHLGDSDWPGAAIAGAQALGGKTSSSGGFSPIWVVLILGLLVVAILWFVQARRRKQLGPQATATRTADPDSPEALAYLPTADLDRRASSALVAVDDAVKTADQELGFAQAQFGEEATQEFSAALTDAKAKVSQAFTLRQQLDDDVPETEPQGRAMRIQIVVLCHEATDAMDAQSAKFEELRQLEARAPQVLEELAQRATEVQGRVDPARSALATLQQTYPASALASVEKNPDQAAALIQGALATVQEGRDDLARGDRGAAVARSRAAGSAVGQAVTLLDAVDRAGDDLASAAPRLDAGITSISSDLADAQRLAPQDAGVLATVGPAQQAIAVARAARAQQAGSDPLAALAGLSSAEASLDAALAPFRERAEQDARAAAVLQQTLGRVQSQVRATSDFVATRRGAVGAEARTRLAEAQRLLDQAVAQQRTAPQAALASAQQAEQQATSAQQLAQQDVDRFDDRGSGGGGGSNLGGMVLGGILIDSILRGRGGFGGGWGGGGWGGGGFGGGGGGGGAGPSRGGRF